MVVITGGSKGIGRAIAEKFASNGHDIALCARNKTALEKVAEDLTKKHGVAVSVFAADVSQKEEVLGFASFVQQLKREVTVLVNNAGVFLPGEILSGEEGDLETMINTNLYSAYYLTRALIGDMVKAKNGYIFNICSIASKVAYPNGSGYAISKHALLGFSKCLREETKDKGIRVTAIMPGATLTASWDGVNLPAERFIKAEDVADLVFSAFKLSPQSDLEELTIRPQLGDI